MTHSTAVTSQERNKVRMLSILNVIDQQAADLEDLCTQHRAMVSSLRLAVLRRGSHTNLQLVAMRQGIKRQEDRLQNAADQLHAALELALDMEVN